MQTRGAQLGALIGAVGGLTFVWINAGALPTPWRWAGQALGAALFLTVLWRLRAGPAAPGPRPAPRAWRVYWASVLLMGLALPLGAGVLGRLGLQEAVVLWVVLVVGLHFFPFAHAFQAPMFGALARSLTLLALAGLGGSLAGWSWAPAGTAALAGFVLLGFSGGWLSRAREP